MPPATPGWRWPPPTSWCWSTTTSRPLRAGSTPCWPARRRPPITRCWAGGRVRYVAAAGLDHRRAGSDARLPGLARAAYRRGRTARRYDERRGDVQPPTHELRALAGCAWHTVRRRCANGVVMGAHAAGRVAEALDPAPVGGPDFVSGRSGTVVGRRAALAAVADFALDAREAISGRRARLRRAAA